MAAHRFNDPTDPTKGGAWLGDYGRLFCKWTWDAAAKALTVTRGSRGKRIDLSNIGDQLLTPEELRERLPQLALEVAERIGERG
jgi:hypothetical protein